uniref:Uncharacterized protein n=1 Tax=Setaria viridis TaxID=4556 RepID=A0A4U6SVW4_SETVI|nr:hypothetical protein SEVIR_9G198950v2 [Setaria viridis]
MFQQIPISPASTTAPPASGSAIAAGSATHATAAATNHYGPDAPATDLAQPASSTTPAGGARRSTHTPPPAPVWQPPPAIPLDPAATNPLSNPKPRTLTRSGARRRGGAHRGRKRSPECSFEKKRWSSELELSICYFSSFFSFSGFFILSFTSFFPNRVALDLIL